MKHFLECHDLAVQVRTSPHSTPVATVWVEEEDRERAEGLMRDFHGPRLVHPRWTCATCGEENDPTFEWCWQCQSEAGATSG